MSQAFTRGDDEVVVPRRVDRRAALELARGDGRGEAEGREIGREREGDEGAVGLSCLVILDMAGLWEIAKS